MLEMLKERKAALEAQGKKGFTLMEMLIVIAIIAILIAIAIPIFTSQMEAAKEGKDAANLRAAYATAAAQAALKHTTVSAGPVAVEQTGNWESVTGTIGGQALPTGSGPFYVTVTADGAVSIGTDHPGTVVDPTTGQ